MVQKSRENTIFNIIVYAFMVIFLFIMIYPLWYCLINAFSSAKEVYYGNVVWLPKGITLENYVAVFREKSLLSGYLNTVFYTFAGTVIGLFVTFTAAYPLSRKDMYGRNVFMKLYLLPMFISGGLVPTYIIVKKLGLYDTFWALVLPGAVGVWNVVVVRTFMISSIPGELQEAAMLDGAGNIKIFTSVIIPLSRPILAVMTMFHIVGYWNTYFNALIYLNDEAKYPIQLVLRKILIQNDIDSLISSGNVSASILEQTMRAEAIKYAAIIVTITPLLVIYPFFEKFFEKGMVVGSLKG
ncbi:MAG: carbohydrate ABC transporter permease [Christensenellaceae bacterium]|nr:carbohydrate ABC transporter permease [Christensenellaceae bacterium]MDD6927181.1 carbohydrate ABC transporter permease [bacterium]MDY2850523.1 carbohydrate ABC transporter permease [Christensenellaceae bacterium]